MKYQIVAQTDTQVEYNMELLDDRAKAEELAEEYAKGKECAWYEVPGTEQPGRHCISFIPTHRLVAVYVVPKEK
jgi:hypothetical protein